MVGMPMQPRKSDTDMRLTRFFQIRLVISLLGLVFVTSCATSIYQKSAQIPPDILNAPPPAEATALWNQAVKAADSGNYTQAINTWERIASYFPTNAIAPRALSAIGRLYLHQGHPETALSYFDQVLRYFPQWNGISATRVDRLEALWAAGQHGKAVEEAREFWQQGPADTAIRVRLCEFLARAASDSGNIDAAMHWLEQGYRSARDEKQRNGLNRTAFSIFDSLDENQVRQLFNQSPSAIIRPFLEYRLVRLKMATEATGKVRDQLLALMKKYPDHPISDQIRKLFTQGNLLVKVPLHADRIGCLVPMSGKYASYGSRILRGTALALEAWNQDHPDDLLTVVVKDTRAQPHQALQAFQQLAEDYGVLAVLGPISARCTSALSAKATEYGIPMLTFTQKESVDNSSPFTFHLLIDNQDLVQDLVRYCRDQLGFERFATLFPDDRYGKQLSQTFVEAVQQDGAQVVATVSYKQGTTDFKTVIGQLQRQAKENPYRDDQQAIQGLFIPDQAQTVALIAPQLPYYNLVGVTLLGTNLWDDPAFIKIGGVYVENAVFATAFPPDDETPDVTRFRQLYQEAYGGTPHYFAAQAYDALNMVLQARQQHGSQPLDRLTLQQDLLDMSSFDGLTGTASFLPDGMLRRSYRIYRIVNGQAVPANP